MLCICFPSRTLKRFLLRRRNPSIAQNSPPLSIVQFVAQLINCDETGTFIFSSEPPGATILIDGTPHEKKTPASIDVAGGITHRIELQMDGFHPAVLSERLKASEQKDLSITLKPTILKLEILTVPSGARVKLGSQVIGKSPLKFDYDADLPYPYFTITKPGCKMMETTWPIDRDKYIQKKIYELEDCR